MQTEIDKLMNRIWSRKIPFFIVFFVIVLATYGFLVIIDFIPESITENADKSTATEAVKEVFASENLDEIDTETFELDTISEVSALNTSEEVADIGALPRKIIFDALDREVDVLNPQSRTIADLDEALLSGAVRHPDSADFVEKGTMFLFGHSSYLPNVFNKNFQAFNGIEKLDWGDTIRVQSDDIEYVYFVERVYQVSATVEEIAIDWGTSTLTLVTCNSFGAKEDRWVLEAKLVSQNPL